jgi:hypothetical protein
MLVRTLDMDVPGFHLREVFVDLASRIVAAFELVE